jgi:hypothetical protein
VCTLTLSDDAAVAADMPPIAGTFTGTYSHTIRAFGCAFTNRGTLTVSFGRDGAVLTSGATVTGLELRDPSHECALVTNDASGSAPATPTAGNGIELTGSWSFAVPRAKSHLPLAFKASVGGDTMTGDWDCPGCTGSFTLTRR